MDIRIKRIGPCISQEAEYYGCLGVVSDIRGGLNEEFSWLDLRRPRCLPVALQIPRGGRLEIEAI